MQTRHGLIQSSSHGTVDHNGRSSCDTERRQALLSHTDRLVQIIRILIRIVENLHSVLMFVCVIRSCRVVQGIQIPHNDVGNQQWRCCTTRGGSSSSTSSILLQSVQAIGTTVGTNTHVRRVPQVVEQGRTVDGSVEENEGCLCRTTTTTVLRRRRQGSDDCLHSETEGHHGNVQKSQHEEEETAMRCCAVHSDLMGVSHPRMESPYLFTLLDMGSKYTLGGAEGHHRES